jgi:hypothetical protein
VNTERFETLAAAFGGDITRWPAAERDAAALLMATRADWAQTVLAEAADLDAALQTYVSPRVTAALTDRIVATGPRAPDRRWTAVLWPAGLGAGLAAACAAGVVAGVYLSAPTVSAEPTESITVAIGDGEYDFDLDGEV